MLKRVSIILITLSFLVALLVGTPPAKAAEIGVSAKAAVLICADTGQILYEKNADERLAMASTTKIMTAILGLEAAQAENTEITITDEMVQVEGSSMGLLPGYVIKLEDVVKGMMMCSGNDAANTVAYTLAGSPSKFAQKMNEKAAQIGMKIPNSSLRRDLTPKVIIPRRTIWRCSARMQWKTRIFMTSFLKPNRP